MCWRKGKEVTCFLGSLQDVNAAEESIFCVPGRTYVRVGCFAGCYRKHIECDYDCKNISMNGGGLLGSVIKKRRKKMRKHKHRKLLARTRHQRRKGK